MRDDAALESIQARRVERLFRVRQARRDHYMRKRLACCQLGNIPRALEPADLVRISSFPHGHDLGIADHTLQHPKPLRVRAQITAVLVARKVARVRASTVAHRLHERRQTKVRERRVEQRRRRPRAAPGLAPDAAELRTLLEQRHGAASL